MKKYIKPELKVIEVTDVIKVSYGQVEDNGIKLDYGTDIFDL